MVDKICEVCGKSFSVINCRKDTAKYCSRKCSDKAKKGQNNVICSTCGKPFHMKESQLKRYDRNLGIFCSKKCLNKMKEIKYCNTGNHQYGLKGSLNASFKGEETIAHNHKLDDIMIYAPYHPYANKSNRVKKHRLIVEQNYTKFNINYFEQINGYIVLKRNIDIHHLDGNHNNNAIDNLIPCTRAEHKHYHKSIIIARDNKGKIIKAKTAVIKSGELLGTPEEDNQQPS